MGDDDEQFRKVTKWAKMLQKEEKIEHALRRLESIDINLTLLSVTGIGKAVNALRKHPEWGDKASTLVSRWKDIARSETVAITAGAQKTLILNKTKGGNFVEKGYDEDHYSMDANKELDGDNDDEPVDAFSAQLAAADSVNTTRKKRSRTMPVTVESIQNSLLDSITNPLMLPHAANAGNRELKQQIDPLEINMFKAPKEKRRVYAGKRKEGMEIRKVPKLYDICIRLLISNIDAIEETGNIPFYVLQPVFERANAIQLRRLEEKNPYLQEDTDYLWMQHCEREFPKELNEMLYNQISDDEDEDMESDNGKNAIIKDGLLWRERYAKFLHERERKLRHLSKKIKMKTSELLEPQRKAAVTDAIAPRNVRKRQILNGTSVSAELIPSVMELTRARRQIFETGNAADFRSMPRAIRNTTSTLGARTNGGNFLSSSSSVKKKQQQRGPLMLKTLKMLKKQKR